MKKTLFFLLVFSISAGAIETGENISEKTSDTADETTKSKLEISGNLDVKYAEVLARKSSPIYGLMFYPHSNLSSSLSQTRLEPYLNFDYGNKEIAFHSKNHGIIYGEADSTFDILELYGEFRPNSNIVISAGKRAFNWGKGYIFNTVGYVNPIKDPENPELIQIGKISVMGEYTKTFSSGLLQVFSLSMLSLPPTSKTNHFGESRDTNFAIKSYFLIHDTDIDLMAYSSTKDARQYGGAFSRNILDNVEVHGELSFFKNASKYVVKTAKPEIDTIQGNSYLIGARYLNSVNTTIIGEFYHNGMGLTKADFNNYLSYLKNFLASGSAQAIQQENIASKSNLPKTTLMQDYLYFKVSQPEPFNWVYFTPSIFALINTQDNSYNIATPLSYKPITNLELDFIPTFFCGASNTEFGEKQIEQRYEVWLRVYF